MMRHFPRTLPVLILAAALLAPDVALGQGTVSTQGLGFPPGQLSTPSRTMGGANGEIDPLSPLNPAAIGMFRNAIVYMQGDPEFREVRVGNQLQRTSVARFPVFVGALNLGSRWTVSAAASTLLDRTWTTTSRDTQVVGGDTLRGTAVQRSDGSISDLRLAVAFATTTWLRLGVGGHAYSGRDLLETVRTFDDSTRFARDTQATTLGFSGNAISLGAHAFWPRIAAVGVSYRMGGGMTLYQENDKVASAGVPDRFGVSVSYLGIQGTTLAVRAARDNWSSLRNLGGTLNVHEGWDMGAGAEVRGPTVGRGNLQLRGGGRWRTLPFSVNATPVRETTWSGGFGLPFAGGRVEINMGALRSTRTEVAGVSERAWTISTAIAVRP